MVSILCVSAYFNKKITLFQTILAIITSQWSLFYIRPYVNQKLIYFKKHSSIHYIQNASFLYVNQKLIFF